MQFKQHVFISDVHIGAFSSGTNKQIEEDLIALIHHCKEEKIAIYILGDLFDYWMEYPEQDFVPSLGSRVLDAFEDYNHSVAPALFITGNHDNWTFGHFDDRGFDTESNFRLVDIDDNRLLLMHGDGVAASKIDFPRAAFHRFLRNRTFIQAYQKVLSPNAGIKTMKLFSSITRKRNYHNPEPLNRQAKKILQKQSIQYIITGHDHIPRKETFPGGSYINLGTFFNHRTIGLYNKEGLRLVKWNASAEIFLPFEGSK